jgi:hypothetical protein
MLPAVILLLAASLCLAACGDDDGDGEGTARQEADSRAVEELAQRYVAALAEGDERAACATRARQERQRMARTAGSCERAFAALMATTDFAILQDARIGTVTVRGDRASVSYALPGDPGADDRLLATRESGRWVLIGDGSKGTSPLEGIEQLPPRVQGRACPRGTPLVRPADLGDELPPGHELADAAEESPVVDVLRATQRDQLRRIETKVLVRAGSELGTAVIVVNTRRRQPERRFLADAMAGAQAAGAGPRENVEIAGSKGALVTGPGGVFAAALITPCASVLLTDADEARLRRAGTLLNPPQR